MTSLQNSPYFICHYGVPGRSGKAGAGLWYKNGVLTEEGYRHYYGTPNPQSPPQLPAAPSQPSRFSVAAKNAYSKVKTNVKQNYNEIRNGDSEKGRKLAEQGKTKSGIIIGTIAQNIGAKMISNYASHLVSRNGKSVLSSAVRMAGNAFILKNTLDSVKEYRNLSKYKKETANNRG